MSGAIWTYRLLFRTMQSARRLRRRWVRVLRPAWRQPLTRVLPYVNFLRLIPLTAAMILVPRHFFRNLRAIARGHNSCYPTPLAVATSFAVLVCVLAALVDLPPLYWWIAGLLGIIALLGPVWAIVCAYLVRKLNGGRFSAMSDGWEELLLSRDAYRRLDRRMYLQGLLYLNVYFLSIMPVMLLLVIVRAGIPAFAHLLPVDMDRDLHEKLSELFTHVASGITAWIASWAIVRPSGILFVSCVDVPGQRFYEVGFGRLKRRIESAFYAKPRKKDQLLEKLRNEWRYMVAELRKQELRARIHHPDRLVEMLRDRTSAAIDIAGLRALFDDKRDAALLEPYYRVSNGQLICSCEPATPLALGAGNVA